MPIHNPILPGFHPDPSICQVGGEYYIANSTFEWFPGVPIHHSRDLKHWRLIGHILTEPRMIDLRGVPDSAGVWAPSLSYADGRFWLVYTQLVNTGMGRPFKDIRIFITTSTGILDPWSTPVRMDSVGFDPSIFHDSNGRKYLLNMEWDFRKDHYRFAGIVLQEFDPLSLTFIGTRRRIFEKHNLLTEGPNLYQRDGWYYLMLAEGGTGWNHGISAARSRDPGGPYEVDPSPSVLTTRNHPDWWLQKAGHGEIVETPDGETFLVHLGSRPAGERRCMLGRETCIQRVEWRDGWLRLTGGGTLPLEEITSPAGLPDHPWPQTPLRDDFDEASMDVSWSALRVPMNETWLSLSARPGWLRLTGRESLHSLFEQSLVAKRVVSHRFTAETRMDFQPTRYTQMAGLVFYYGTHMHYYLRVTRHEDSGTVIGVVLTDDSNYDELGDLPVNNWKEFHLRALVNGTTVQFLASPDGSGWIEIGPLLDATKLSDDYGAGLHFTGAMIGICAQDLAHDGGHADFDYFQITPLP